MTYKTAISIRRTNSKNFHLGNIDARPTITQLGRSSTPISGDLYPHVPSVIVSQLLKDFKALIFPQSQVALQEIRQKRFFRKNIKESS